MGIFRGISATVAFALMDSKDFNRDSYYVDFVGVLQASQGKGKGKGSLLMSKAEDFAKSKNFWLLSLSVIGRNTGAI